MAGFRAGAEPRPIDACFQLCNALRYSVIRTFRHKGLADLFARGRSARVDRRLQARILRRLDALDGAATLSELNVPGFDFHPLRGFDPVRYSIHVNGPWCITFEFADGDVYRVDLEQYH